MMPLVVYKTSHSVNPWRIALQHIGDLLCDIPDAHFARKREAQAFLAQLNALGDWDAFNEWSVEQHAALQRCIDPFRQKRLGMAARACGWERGKAHV